MVGILGIVNVTRDSFSDGGQFLRPAAAIAHAEQLLADGAAVVDVGAESTHPDAEDVTAAEEIARLEPVVAALLRRGAEVSVDTTKPDVMAAMAARGVAWLNDVAGFRSAAAVAAAARSTARLCVMFARNDRPRAARTAAGAGDVVAEAGAFFADRIAALEAAGVARSRIVLDPGMGFFLGREAAPSLEMLRRLPELRRFGLPLLVSVSRKSFLGELTGRGASERGAATLAAELFAAQQGVDWIRTHDVRALRDALLVWQQCAPGRPATPQRAPRTQPRPGEAIDRGAVQ
jgi:dihydropteroate synthase type 2